MEEDSQHITTEIFYRISEVFHLTRILMGQVPLAAEAFCDPEAREKIEEAFSRGANVILHVPPGEPPAYIVIRNGTRYTTSVRPQWASDEEIPVVETGEPEPKLLPALQAACQIVERLSPESYGKLRMGDMLTSVSGYYSDQIPSATATQMRISEALGGIHFPSQASSNAEVMKWVEDCRRALLQRYAGFLLAGNTVLPSLSTLFLLEWTPLPAIDILGDDLRRSGAAALLENLKSSGQGIDVSPSLNLKICMVYLLLNHQEGAAPSVIRAASSLVSWGDKLLGKAKSNLSFELFHQGLFGSLIYYRLAQFLLNSLFQLEAELHGDAIGHADLRREAKRLAYMCEEMRVQIMASFASFHDVGIPRLGDARSFWDWLARLEEWDISDARNEITNLSIQLLLPDFLQRIAKDWLSLQKPESFDLGYSRLTQTAQQLEAVLPRNVALGETNYLSTLYARMADKLEEHGRSPEAEALRQRADPAYFQAELDKHDWTGQG